MYKYIGLILLVPLALSACQDNSTPPQQAEPTASQAAAPVVSESEPQPDSATLSTKEGATDTVAVTKLPKSNVAASVEQSMKQSQADAAATLSGMAETPKAKAADKAAVVEKQQPVAVSKPVATVQKTIVAPKKPVVAVKKAAAVPAPVAMGDAVKGKAKARKCAACHNFNDKKKVGPGLAGVVGRKAGTMADMKYSQALSTATWSWNEKNLALWLCDSKEAVKTLSGNPGASTKMPSQRICDAADQANLIAYLKTL